MEIIGKDMRRWGVMKVILQSLREKISQMILNDCKEIVSPFKNERRSA